jgi:alkanesulfonate monooxygenase SsuD/methylene tetrahydromethanopterin reductase-like flavin-dependent oxidoreductase (luciferase family)
VQKPHPPMWVGGHSRAVLQRRARHGNSWHPIGGAVAFPLRLQEVWAHLDMLKQPTEAGRRDFSALTISYKAPLYDTGIPSPDGSRRFFSSEPEHIAGGIRTSAAIGVHKLIFDFCGGRLWRALSACSGSPPQLIPLMTG